MLLHAAVSFLWYTICRQFAAKQCWTAGSQLQCWIAGSFFCVQVWPSYSSKKTKCGQHFTSHLRWKINSESSCASSCRNCPGKLRKRNHWRPSLSCTNNVLCISVVHASQVFTIFSFHSHVMAEPVPKGRFFILMYLPFKSSSSSKLFFFCLYTVLCLFYFLLSKATEFSLLLNSL